MHWTNINLIRWGFPLMPVLCLWAVLFLVHSWLGWWESQTLLLELALPCIYYWRIYRPESFMKGFVFLTGLIVDLLVMAPFGLHAFLYVAVIMFVDAQRGFLSQRHFRELWFIFIGCCAWVMLGRGADGELVE